MTRHKSRPTITEFYSNRMVSTLSAAKCGHQEPRGALYCALCRKAYLTGQFWGPR